MKSTIAVIISSGILFSCAPGFVSNVSNPTNNGQSQTGTEIPSTNPPAVPGSAIEKLKAISNEYRAKYSLNDAFAKLVDDRGNKFAALYGVRNFRVVLHGVYYRGGANNSYNTVDGIRSNSNPLPASGLKNLCEQDFKEAIYLYSTNYDSSPKSVSCVNYKNEKNTLQYEQISPLSYTNNEKYIQKVFEVIKGKRSGPIYGHCWNGWHASGFVSAILLKQFCSYSGAKAVDYWTKNTDGNSAGHDSLLKQISDFQPLIKYQISAEESALICP